MKNKNKQLMKGFVLVILSGIATYIVSTFDVEVGIGLWLAMLSILSFSGGIFFITYWLGADIRYEQKQLY